MSLQHSFTSTVNLFAACYAAAFAAGLQARLVVLVC
jgi:hypothetical protein